MTAISLHPYAILPTLADVAQPEDMKPGAWAFVIVVGLLIVTVLLWFSLRKQLGRIEVPPGKDAKDEDAGDGTEAGEDPTPES